MLGAVEELGFLLSCANPSPDCLPPVGAAGLGFVQIQTVAWAVFVGSRHAAARWKRRPGLVRPTWAKPRGFSNPARAAESLPRLNAAIRGLCAHSARMCLCVCGSPGPGPAILSWEEGSLRAMSGRACACLHLL